MVYTDRAVTTSAPAEVAMAKLSDPVAPVPGVLPSVDSLTAEGTAGRDDLRSSTRTNPQGVQRTGELARSAPATLSCHLSRNQGRYATWPTISAPSFSLPDQGTQHEEHLAEGVAPARGASAPRLSDPRGPRVRELAASSSSQAVAPRSMRRSRASSRASTSADPRFKAAARGGRRRRAHRAARGSRASGSSSSTGTLRCSTRANSAAARGAPDDSEPTALAILTALLDEPFGVRPRAPRRAGQGARGCASSA